MNASDAQYDALSRLIVAVASLGRGPRPADLNMHKALISEPESPVHPASSRRSKTGINDWLTAEIAAVKPRRVLDIGCGFGTLLASIRAEHTCDTIGLSPTPFTVAYANRFWRDHQPGSAPDIRLQAFGEPVVARPGSDFETGSERGDDSGSSGISETETETETESRSFDLIIALESIGYSADLTDTLSWLDTLLDEHGTVWLLDDWRIAQWPEHASAIQALGRCWHRPRLYSVEDLLNAAGDHGLSLVDRVDFTHRVPAVHQRPGSARRVCLRIAKAVSGATRCGEVASAFLGGWYLESLYNQGAVRYELIKLQRLPA
ncbi:MAG: methyltransferase domain-containing protein [Pseudomonadota bacterium]